MPVGALQACLGRWGGLGDLQHKDALQAQLAQRLRGRDRDAQHRPHDLRQTPRVQRSGVWARICARPAWVTRLERQPLLPWAFPAQERSIGDKVRANSSCSVGTGRAGGSRSCDGDTAPCSVTSGGPSRSEQ